MSKHHQLEESLLPAASRELWITKAVLLVIVLGLCVVGKSLTLWPIITWPMYSGRIPQFPAASACAVELRVVNSVSAIRRLAPSDLLPLDRASVAANVIEHALNNDHPLRDGHRIYLSRLVKHILSDFEIQTIQGWRVCWEVNPLALPPLDRDRPHQEVLLGSFTAPLDGGG